MSPYGVIEAADRAAGELENMRCIRIRSAGLPKIIGRMWDSPLGFGKTVPRAGRRKGRIIQSRDNSLGVRGVEGPFSPVKARWQITLVSFARVDKGIRNGETRR